jgi:hypothetical protein
MRTAAILYFIAITLYPQIAAAAAFFTSAPNGTVTVGQSVNITWSGAAEWVQLALANGTQASPGYFSGFTGKQCRHAQVGLEQPVKD